MVILGQDPYHTPGAAMGLSFSVPQDHKIQPSVRNMLKELYFDCEIQRISHDLTDWAQK